MTEEVFILDTRVKSNLADAEAYFEPLQDHQSNGEVLLATLGSNKIGEFITERLVYIDNTPGVTTKWHEDDALLSRLDEEAKNGNVLVPTEPVAKQRWLALLCNTAIWRSKYQGVDVPPEGDNRSIARVDWLPEDDEVFLRGWYPYFTEYVIDTLARRMALRGEYDTPQEAYMPAYNLVWDELVDKAVPIETSYDAD